MSLGQCSGVLSAASCFAENFQPWPPGQQRLRRHSGPIVYFRPLVLELGPGRHPGAENQASADPQVLADLDVELACAELLTGELAEGMIHGNTVKPQPTPYFIFTTAETVADQTVQFLGLSDP